MTDCEIVRLFWDRNENAITETEKKYDKYLMKIVKNFLSDIEDCKEVVSDTYLLAWNSIPPHRPDKLSLFLAKISREKAIDIFRKSERQKRKHSQYSISLSELDDCISGNDNTENEVEFSILSKKNK